jgi:3-methyladenine DNA glycosylase AlkD
MATNKRAELVKELENAANQADAVFLQHFFKTGPGEYGEGDRFLGIRVPKTRQIASYYQKELNISDLEELLSNKWHEIRLVALIIMVNRFKKSDLNVQTELYNLYLKHIGIGINNWDLVDISCPNIVGAYLFDKDREPLYKLAKGNLWQKRVSIISSFYFIRQGDPIETYNLAETLIYEKHDLLQKAVGWALREMGKTDGHLLKQFLDKYAPTMPRTALRYSLEKMDQNEKAKYMGLKPQVFKTLKAK